MPTYRADLETEVDGLEYNLRTGVGRLYMPRCTDMDGCIQLFTAIDPNVKTIRTLSGLEWDTVYDRHGDGWKARQPRQRNDLG